MTTQDLAESAPSVLTVEDTYGQRYELDAESPLWADALARHLAGEERVVYSAQQLSDAREWGWWSCFRSQERWLAECGVPVPDHRLLYGLAEASDQQLRELLQRFGGYVAWLEAQLGQMEGRAHALKKGYDAAVMVRGSEGDKKATERSKEAAAVAHSETLRQTKRMQIEQEALLATAKGLLDGYKAAYDTVSRIVTTRQIEAEVTTTRRHP